VYHTKKKMAMLGHVQRTKDNIPAKH